jgi:hypothetical protein
MSAPDLHPEELLDKAAAGTLADGERAWLDGHLSQCAVCRFELEARKDFQSFESPGLNVDNVVARALSGLPAAEKGATQPPSLRTNSGKGLARFAVAALVLFTTMASFAAVATVTGVLPRLLEAISGPAVETELPRPPAPRAAPSAPAPEQPALPEPAPESPALQASPPPPPPLVVAPVSPIPRAVARAEIPALPPPPAVEVPDAGALFARANQARVRGDRPGAVRLYGELLEQFPGGEEARVAQATLGRLLLDSGDPQGALAQLDAYLQGGDATLREEVLAARATALSRLNRPRDEAAAWNTLLESYPDSVHGARARSRLADLEAR